MAVLEPLPLLAGHIKIETRAVQLQLTHRLKAILSFGNFPIPNKGRLFRVDIGLIMHVALCISVLSAVNVQCISPTLLIWNGICNGYQQNMAGEIHSFF